MLLVSYRLSESIVYIALGHLHSTRNKRIPGYVFVVVLTITRIVKSVVTGQVFSHSGAEEYPRGKRTQPKAVHAHITADAIHASTRNIPGII